MTEEEKKLKFVEEKIPLLILKNNKHFKDNSIVKCSVKIVTELNGFMSEIYSLHLTLKDPNEGQKTYYLIVKTMKGDEEFREKTKAEVQFSNEIYIYKKVIPYFCEFLENTKIDAYQWVPKIFFADYAVFKELSDFKETILVIENLKFKNYRMGPRIDLDEDHLCLMMKNIANFHSISYAMRIKNNEVLKELVDGLAPLSFLAKDGSELESYSILFKIALQRFFTHVEEDKNLQENFIKIIRKMKEKSFNHPAALMETFLKIEDYFSVILHGDFYRSNVLFQYPKAHGYENVIDVKMFDFQETRFASPSIDLSVFMYLNMSPSLRTHLWEKLLKLYHETVMKNLTEILKCKSDDKQLEPFSFNNFLAHFKNYAFYGLMVSIHSIPWHLCNEGESQKIAELFEKDMKSEEFRNFLQNCGGEVVDKRIIGNALHAFENGYLDIFE